MFWATFSLNIIILFGTGRNIICLAQGTSFVWYWENIICLVPGKHHYFVWHRENIILFDTGRTSFVWHRKNIICLAQGEHHLFGTGRTSFVWYGENVICLAQGEHHLFLTGRTFILEGEYILCLARLGLSIKISSHFDWTYLIYTISKCNIHIIIKIISIACTIIISYISENNLSNLNQNTYCILSLSKENQNYHADVNQQK